MATWVPIKEYRDLLFERVEGGKAKITINRPAVRNAFRTSDHHGASRTLSNSVAQILQSALLSSQGKDLTPSALALTLKSIMAAIPAKVLRPPISWTYKSKSARF